MNGRRVGEEKNNYMTLLEQINNFYNYAMEYYSKYWIGSSVESNNCHYLHPLFFHLSANQLIIHIYMNLIYNNLFKINNN